MRKISQISLMLLLLSTAISNGQNFGLGIKGGITLATLAGGGGNPINEGYKFQTGGTGDIFAEFKINGKVSIQTGVGYSTQGGKRGGYHAIVTSGLMSRLYIQEYNKPAPTYMYADFDESIKLNYLSLPILIKYGLDFSKDSPFRVYVSGGPFVSLLMKAQYDPSGRSSIYADSGMQEPLTGTNSFSSANIKSDLHRGNFGIQGNIGVSYKANNNSFFVECGNSYGLKNINKLAENGKNTTYYAAIQVGLFHTFGSNQSY